MTNPTENALNLYGDKPRFESQGHGADIASQRADDLDLIALGFLRSRPHSSTTMALDLACGKGGQAYRMALAGARVIAVDSSDFEDDILKLRKSSGGLNISFLKEDMRFLDFPGTVSFDIIICQRAIHYLPHLEAIKVVARMGKWLKPDGRIFLSASGANSELGSLYPGLEHNVEDRFHPLDPAMQEKHDIRGDVCLYTQDDIHLLAKRSNLQVLQSFLSPFGNIKAVLVHV